MRSLPRMLALIRGTTTATGLRVKAVLDTTAYTTGIKISPQQMATVNIRRRRLCPDLNYSIRPSKSGSS
jgi:hypothetical protein